MRAYLPILIVLGLSLFILRTQLLRVAIRRQGMDDLHASRLLGAVSGWISLAGALGLLLCAFAGLGLLLGAGVSVLGLGLGIIAAGFALPGIGQTTPMGHMDGEGDARIAAFNRAYGHWFGFAVGALALVCLYLLFTP